MFFFLSDPMDSLGGAEIALVFEHMRSVERAMYASDSRAPCRFCQELEGFPSFCPCAKPRFGLDAVWALCRGRAVNPVLGRQLM